MKKPRSKSLLRFWHNLFKCRRFINKEKWRVAVNSFLCAIFLIVVGYFCNNSPLFTGESFKRLHFYETLDDEACKNEFETNGVIYYNVAYDRCMVPAISEVGDTIGQTAILNRDLLRTFLELLSRCDDYRFVLVDVILDFEDNIYFDNDSLKSIIEKFGDRIVFPRCNFAYPEMSDNITAWAEFYNLRTSKAFTRYKYLDNDKRSIPLHIYEKENGGVQIKRFGLIDWLPLPHFIKNFADDIFSVYMLDGKLVQNCLFLTFNETSIIKPNSYKMFNYRNMGEDINYVFPATVISPVEFLNTIVKDKIVVIGDCSGENDVYSTYMEKKAGSEIMMRALHSIEEGLIYVSWRSMILWFFIFWGISFFIIYDRPVFMYSLRKYIRSKFTLFIMSLMTYSLILLLAEYIEYAFTDRVYSITFPILFFTILKLQVQYKKYEILDSKV